MRYLMLLLVTVVATGLVACGKKNNSVANPNTACVNGICGPGGVGVYGYGYSTMNSKVAGALENIGEGAFAALLGQYGGFCQNNGWNNHPGQLSWSATIGSWNCKSYAKRGYIKMRFDQNASRVQIKVGARGNQGVAPETLLEGRIFPINNSAGMEIRAAGAQGTGSWSAQYDNGLVIRIQQGLPSSLSMTGEVTYRGQPMGTVQLYRY